MKLNLKPGISPAMLWTTVGVGIGGTAAGALSLTAYAWAPMVISLIGVLIMFFQGRLNQVPPPAAPAPETPAPPEGRGDERRPPAAP